MTTNAKRAAGPRPFAPGWWIVTVTLGGMLSLFAPAFGFLVAQRLEMPPWVAYPLIALAGGVMGLVMGAAQAGALHRTVLEVRRAGWTLLTAVGALVSWALGMMPATMDALGEPLDLASPRILAAVIAGLLVLVLAVPALQWLLLRRIVAHAWRWIPITLVAGGLSLAAGWLGVQLHADPGQDDLVPALVIVAVMAFVHATVTGLGLSWLARSARGRG